MRVITLCIALLFPALAFADSDYSIEWSINSPIGDSQYNRIILDINEGTTALTANGMFISGDNAAPATGTCFFIIGGKIHCGLTVSAATFTIDLLSSLNGSVSLIYSDAGEVAETSLIEVTSIN